MSGNLDQAELARGFDLKRRMISDGLRSHMFAGVYRASEERKDEIPRF
jgi:hypothetical protein